MLLYILILCLAISTYYFYKKSIDIEKDNEKKILELYNKLSDDIEKSTNVLDQMSDTDPNIENKATELQTKLLVLDLLFPVESTIVTQFVRPESSDRTTGNTKKPTNVGLSTPTPRPVLTGKERAKEVKEQAKSRLESIKQRIEERKRLEEKNKAIFEAVIPDIRKRMFLVIFNNCTENNVLNSKEELKQKINNLSDEQLEQIKNNINSQVGVSINVSFINYINSLTKSDITDLLDMYYNEICNINA